MSNLSTVILPTTPTTDPALRHSLMHNSENALLNVHDAAILALQQQYGQVIPGVEQTGNKGIAGGYAGLDSNGLVPLINIPVVTAWQLTSTNGTVYVASITNTGALVTTAVGTIVNGYGGNYGVTTYA